MERVITARKNVTHSRKLHTVWRVNVDNFKNYPNLKEYSSKESEVVEDHIFSTVSCILQIHKCSLKLLMEFRMCYPQIWHFDIWNILNWRNFRNSRYKNSNLYLRKVIRSSCETDPPDTLRKGTSLSLKVDGCWGIWDNRMAKLSPGYYS